jgi:4'-phosphopantetheinyl transferase
LLKKYLPFLEDMKQGRENPTFSFQTGDIHVWLFNLESIDHDPFFWERNLDEEEIARSNRYIFEPDSLRFLAGRDFLRQLISRYTGIDPAEINYLTNPYGKLFLPFQSLSFNNSKSQDRIVFAFTMEEEIGVDIEHVHLIPDLSDLIDFCFSQEEKIELSFLPPASHLEAFYHVWTQKEAFLKAQSKGLTVSLQDFSVSVDPDKPGKLLNVKDSDASLYQMITSVPESDYRVALCTRMKNKPEVHWIMPNWSDFVSGDEFARIIPEKMHPF